MLIDGGTPFALARLELAFTAGIENKVCHRRRNPTSVDRDSNPHADKVAAAALLPAEIPVAETREQPKSPTLRVAHFFARLFSPASPSKAISNPELAQKVNYAYFGACSIVRSEA